MLSAKLPVKHIPIAPTPRPPRSAWARRARARSHWVTGLEAFAPSARSSALTHARFRTRRPASARGYAPSRPNSDGM